MSVKHIEELTEIALPGMEDWLPVAVNVGGGVYQTMKSHRKNLLRMAELTENTAPGSADNILVEKLVSGVPTMMRAQIGKLPFTISGGIRWVDKVNGNDATGTPFKTIGAARSAAAVGETIAVGPGVYDEKDLLKSGVYYLFLPGAIVRYTGSSGYLFTDNGAAVTSKISGWGIFEYAGVDGTNSGVFKVSHASTDCGFEFDECEGNSAYVFSVSNGRLTPKGNKIHTLGWAVSVNNGYCDWNIGEVNGQVEINNLTSSELMTIRGGGIFIPSGQDQNAINIHGGRIDIRVAQIAGDVTGLQIDEGTGVSDVRVFGTTIRNFANSGTGCNPIYLANNPTRVILDGVKLIAAGSYSVDSVGSAALRIYAQTLANRTIHGTGSGGLVNFYSGSTRFEVDADLV